ncbi:MAG: 7-carboxy-7-deazaguanine synthase [Candidatus Sericytochromatia bacterium]|uniref:7-carboxy-7-deazaguanine synthase n=1 Tax=Candidatus Tanganyikabacteria bacterium TaxID=2961651 RepID=A0A938BP27_9BACT|nr:7-carboxy-7-deazaguanine synthase [Candidatus Tanganyikabacteria bacterium]
MTAARDIKPYAASPAASVPSPGATPAAATTRRASARTHYAVKEIFYTLQGEGANSGRPAVFLRFAGCNLWSGLERDRHTALCKFCDTDFVGTDGSGGGVFTTADALAEAVSATWSGQIPDDRPPLVVCTGGEPLLQLDDAAVAALHAAGFEVAIETNGTLRAPRTIDWICVSPKAHSDVVQRSGQELKLVFPQSGLDPAAFEDWDFEHHFLQPMDGPDVAENTRQAVAYCLMHPRWRLSLQLHKILGIP